MCKAATKTGCKQNNFKVKINSKEKTKQLTSILTSNTQLYSVHWNLVIVTDIWNNHINTRHLHDVIRVLKFHWLTLNLCSVWSVAAWRRSRIVCLVSIRVIKRSEYDLVPNLRVVWILARADWSVRRRTRFLVVLFFGYATPLTSKFLPTSIRSVATPVGSGPKRSSRRRARPQGGGQWGHCPPPQIPEP